MRLLPLVAVLLAPVLAAGEAPPPTEGEVWTSLDALFADVAAYRAGVENQADKAATQAAWDGLLRKWGQAPGMVPPGDERGLVAAVLPAVGTGVHVASPLRTPAFAQRLGSARPRAVAQHGGSLASEAAVASALRWFKRHQSPNGSWDAVDYVGNCAEAPKCEPGSLGIYAPEAIRAALTGYALLSFLAAGHDHVSPNRHREVVGKGIRYLLEVQTPDGLLGLRNYEHPIATMALIEAYALSGDAALRKPCQMAVDVIVKRQCGDAAGGYGWDYLGPSRRNDGSVTGWNVQALCSAQAAGLKVGRALDGARVWLEAAWRANNDGVGGRPDWQRLNPATDASLFSYCWTAGDKAFAPAFGHQNLAPVGLACAGLFGRRAGDPLFETLANSVLAKQLPTAYPLNTYYLYYGTLGMYQLGGAKWQTWNTAMRDLLVKAQRRGDGCLDGSWDWVGTVFHGNEIGRVLITAHNTLSLEVYYRYAAWPVAKRGR